MGKGNNSQIDGLLGAIERIHRAPAWDELVADAHEVVRSILPVERFSWDEIIPMIEAGLCEEKRARPEVSRRGGGEYQLVAHIVIDRLRAIVLTADHREREFSEDECELLGVLARHYQLAGRRLLRERDLDARIRLLEKGGGDASGARDGNGKGVPAPDGFRSLTLRQREVVRWLAEGKSNSEIATILGISARTVAKHLENIFNQLGAGSRLAVARGWIEAKGQLEQR